MPKPIFPAGFRGRRFRNWAIVGLLYAFFLMSRHNFSALVPTLMDSFGWTRNDLSALEAALHFIYCLSLLVNAIIVDRIGGRRALLMGATGIVFMNLLVGVFQFGVLTPPEISGEGSARMIQTSPTLVWGLSSKQVAYTLSVIWSCNACFQSLGPLALVKINAHWFHIAERGLFAAVFGLVLRLGFLLAFSGVPLITAVLPWCWGFWIPAMLVATLGFATLLFVAERPEDAGFTSMDTGDAAWGPPGADLRYQDVARKIFTSPVFWMFAFTYVTMGFLQRSTVDSWWPVYFKEYHAIGSTEVIYQATAWGIALLGILGGFVAGALSDGIFKGRRAPVAAIALILVLCGLVLFYASDALGLGGWGAFLALALLSFFVNGAYLLLSWTVPMDFGGKKATATVAGFLDGMQYLVAAPLTGVLVGAITTSYGWQVWKLAAIPFALAGAILMLNTWNPAPKGSR